jgi:uncharacterized protein YndB with AHSA1/START domain
MVTATRTIRSTPDEVWDVLADGWLYPLWMVGATAMDEVDGSWPAEGAELHHLTGSWPLAIEQTTTVMESEPGQRLVLASRTRHLGESQIAVTLRPVGSGCEARLERELLSGVRKVVPEPLKRPLLEAWARDSLLRLSFVAERRR